MKKSFYAMIAAIGLLLSPACSNEEELLSGGDEAQVSFTVNLTDGIRTKAVGDKIADGTRAKNLVVGVFEKVGESYQEVAAIRHEKDGAFRVGEDGKITATVDFKLMKGKSYSFIFWAQQQRVATTSPYYDLTDLQNIKVNYTNLTCNDENRDAFLGVVKDYTVTGNFSQSVELSRPFAQLNFLVTEGELEKAKNAGLNITHSIVTISNAAQKLHPFTSTVSEPTHATVTFSAGVVPVNISNVSASANSEQLTYNSATETYYYLASNYFLVAATGEEDNDGMKQATLASVNLKIDGAEGNGLTANSIPVQWNHRTNIYGPLLTAEGTFQVEIKQGFDGDYNDDLSEVETVADVQGAIEKGATIVNVKNAPTTAATLSIPKVFPTNNTQTLVINLPETNQPITINEVNPSAGSAIAAPKYVTICAPNTANITIELPNSTVTLSEPTASSSASYTTVTATTAENTLIVGDGVTIENLTIARGNVWIKPKGVVTNVDRATGNTDEKPIVTLEYLDESTTGTLTNTPESSTNIEVIVQQVLGEGATYNRTNDCYEISNAQGLLWFRKQASSTTTLASKTIKLTADIDMKDLVDGAEGENWKPFGTASNLNGSTIDGGNHTIKNMKICSRDETSIGHAGFLANTHGKITIQNLTFENASVSTGTDYNGHAVGVVIGCIGGEATFRNVKVANSTVEGDSAVGVLLGRGVYTSKATFEDCSVSGNTIKSILHAGGLVGRMDLPSDFTSNISVLNCTVESNTFTPKDNESYYDLNTTISSIPEGKVNTYLHENDPIKGKYYLLNGSYYGAYGAYYVLVGDQATKYVLADDNNVLENADVVVDELSTSEDEGTPSTE